MAATTETFNGNGASFHGVLDRDRCLTDFVDEGSAQSYRYYISRRTVLEMLKDRGYDVLDSELNRSLTEFRSVFGNSPDLDSLRFSVSLRSNPHKKVCLLLSLLLLLLLLLLSFLFFFKYFHRFYDVGFYNNNNIVFLIIYICLFSWGFCVEGRGVVMRQLFIALFYTIYKVYAF